ncbi:MAG TPA: branched-chain amino acid transporter [Oxalobacteraceae bacterium]|nr:branched-chain amino acid transporter [Oxalobacteraceae bacterium]
MNATAMILGMAAITVFLKAIIFLLGDRVVFSPLFRQALGYVPVAVLTAIVVPMVLAPHGKGIELSWRNPQLVAAAVAVIVAAIARSQLVTIMVGLATFFGWQYWLG